jgi:hypothetical protein
MGCLLCCGAHFERARSDRRASLPTFYGARLYDRSRAIVPEDRCPPMSIEIRSVVKAYGKVGTYGEDLPCFL